MAPLLRALVERPTVLARLRAEAVALAAHPPPWVVCVAPREAVDALVRDAVVAAPSGKCSAAWRCSSPPPTCAGPSQADIVVAHRARLPVGAPFRPTVSVVTPRSHGCCPKYFRPDVNRSDYRSFPLVEGIYPAHWMALGLFPSLDTDVEHYRTKSTK